MQLLFQSAVDLGEKGLDRQYGYGLVDAEGVLTRIPDPSAPAPVPGYSRCTEVPCGAAAALSGRTGRGRAAHNLRAVRDTLFVQQVSFARTVCCTHQASVVGC